MSSFQDEVRVIVEEFGQYLRWDVLPKIPKIVLIWGSLAGFIYLSATTPDVMRRSMDEEWILTLQHQKLEKLPSRVASIQSGRIAISD